MDGTRTNHNVRVLEVRVETGIVWRPMVVVRKYGEHDDQEHLQREHNYRELQLVFVHVHY